MRRSGPTPAGRPPIPSDHEILLALPAEHGSTIRAAHPIDDDDAIDVLPAHSALLPVDVLPAEPRVNRALPGLPDEVIAFWHIFEVAAEIVIGTLTLMVALPVLAALPVLQFISLGFMLDVSGQLARMPPRQRGIAGLARFAFEVLRQWSVGLRIVSRAGTIIVCTALLLLPLRLFITSLWVSAEIIDPGSSVAHGWKIGLTVATVLLLIHVGLACACGGKLRHFLLPFLNPFILAYRIWQGGYYARACDGVWEYVRSLRLPFYFWLGLRGFAGGFLWLAIPTSLLALGRVSTLAGYLGGLLLIVVLLFVPLAQMHMVARNRFLAIFDLFGILGQFSRAPLAFTSAFFFTLLLAVPLFLLKIESVPREVVWIPSFFFILSIFPSRLLTAWAYNRASRVAKRNIIIRCLCILLAIALMLATSTVYVIILFFSQYTSWGGVWSLYEQHAFLLPVPFLGM
jgi:hypothetical protein